MRFAYSCFLYLLSPYLLLRLWWKGRRLPAYRRRILERFYLGKRVNKPVDVWVHAVSLGEVIAATPLIEALLTKQWTVLVTTMTPTGSERVLRQFDQRVAHQYVPYDLPGVLKRFFKCLQPRVGVIVETELWPNLVHQAQSAGVPLLLANARLSEKSLKGYMKFRFLFKSVVHAFSGILAQSPSDAERFIALGAIPNRVTALGNMKFDVQTTDIDKAQGQILKNSWGADRVVIIAASTHDDEESQIFSRLKRLQEAIPGLIVLVAPRHPERFQRVYELAQSFGFQTGLRSDLKTLSPDTEVVVLDSLGELLGMFELSDYAFIGGSLVPVGGHNVLEPIAMQVPVFSGPHIHNFKAICSELHEAGGLCLVDGAEALIDALIHVHGDKKAQKQMVDNATRVFERNKGSVNKHLECIERVLLAKK